MSEWVPDDDAFALCLTHDVDRPYKTFQSIYYALRDRDPEHLRALRPGHNPYWTFDEICQLEDDLGVRSAFYFLQEQSLFDERPRRELLSPRAWRLFAGRYDVDDPAIAGVAIDLDHHGWEVGLHGSYEAFDDRERLRTEKAALESVLGHSVLGGRQHYLNLLRPQTWRHQRSVELQYDATPGSTDTVGFDDGYQPFRPFDDEFVVFPLALMDTALPDPGEEFEKAWRVCRGLLSEALKHGAVMTVCWHPRFFSDDYEGYAELYRRLIRKAANLGAWVGPPGELYERWVEAGGLQASEEGGEEGSEASPRRIESGDITPAPEAEQSSPNG